MGAPKQKWTAEEEAALKAGIARYGVGKWSTILKDPEFSGVLRSRSNVDLKVYGSRIILVFSILESNIYLTWNFFIDNSEDGIFH